MGGETEELPLGQTGHHVLSEGGDPTQRQSREDCAPLQAETNKHGSPCSVYTHIHNYCLNGETGALRKLKGLHAIIQEFIERPLCPSFPNWDTAVYKTILTLICLTVYGET